MIPSFLKSCETLLDKTNSSLSEESDYVKIVIGLNTATEELTLSFHKSILSGENYLFVEESDVTDLFTKLHEKIELTLQIAKKNKKESPEEFINKLYVPQLEGLCEFVKLYGDLTRWTIKELDSFGDHQQNFQHFHVSRIINFKSFEQTLFALEAKKDQGVNSQLYFLKLNLILAEFDFHLKCTGQYLNDLIELYRTLDFIEKNHKKYKIRTAIYSILKSKCVFLLKKAFARRHDLDGTFSFLSHFDERIKTVNINTLPIDDFKEFVTLSNSRYDAKYNTTEEEFNKQKKEFDDSIGMGVVSVAAIHYLSKYYHKNKQLDPDKQLAESENLYNSVFEAISKIKHKSKFDRLAYTSTLLTILKNKLRICLETIIRTEDIQVSEKWIKKADSIHHEIDSYQKAQDSINDYYHHKLYMEANIDLCNKYINAIENSSLYETTTLGDSDIEKVKDCQKMVDRLSVLADKSAELYTKYAEGIEWSEKHNFTPIYLPFQQCTCTTDKFGGEDKLFLDSSYVRPVNYEREKGKLIRKQVEISVVVEKLLIENKRLHDKQFDVVRIDILKSSEGTLAVEIKKMEAGVKEKVEKMEKEISNSNIRSVQFLSIFSGVIALSLAAFAGFKDTKDPDQFLMAFFAVGLVLLMFTGAIHLFISTVLEWRKFGALLLLYTVLFTIFFCVSTSHKQNQIMDLTNKVDSLNAINVKNDSSAFGKIDTLKTRIENENEAIWDQLLNEF